MRNIKLIIEYDGTNYSGFQKQDGIDTIQGKIEEALKLIVKEKVNTIGAGRTDAGVHAMGQVINFTSNTKMKEIELLRALNSILPEDIVVKKVEEVDMIFNARRSSKLKHYRYVVNNSNIPSALSCHREYYFKYFLDENIMKIAIQDLIGEHDFKGFKNVGGTITNTTIRKIVDARVTKVGDRYIFDFIGNGFLYNMIRIIVGTLLDIGTGKKDKNIIKEIFDSGDRERAGITVPPQGLFLVEVLYN